MTVPTLSRNRTSRKTSMMIPSKRGVYMASREEGERKEICGKE